MKFRTTDFFENFIQGLIILSLICYSIETLPDLPEWACLILKFIEIITIGIFTIEFIIRWRVSGKKYLKTWAIIDFMATFPILIFLFIPFPSSMEGLRLLRLFRIAKFLCKSKGFRRMEKAIISIIDDLYMVFKLGVVLIFSSSALVYYFESGEKETAFVSIFHTFWWSIVTITTVGYGDMYPETLGGRICSAITIFISIGLIAIPTGLIASAFNNMKNDV